MQSRQELVLGLDDREGRAAGTLDPAEAEWYGSARACRRTRRDRSDEQRVEDVPGRLQFGGAQVEPSGDVAGRPAGGSGDEALVGESRAAAADIGDQAGCAR